MTNPERARLKTWLVGQGVRASVLLAALAGVMASAVAMLTLGSDAGSGPWVVLPVLCLAWVWMLRASPLQLWRGLQDLRSGERETLEGPAAASSEKAPGLFAPNRHYLHIAGARFGVRQADIRRVGASPGVNPAVVLRYAPRSKAVLGLDVKTAQAAPSAGFDVSRLETLEPLTLREQELLRLIAVGLPDKEIARRLNLSPSTVRTYNSTLFAKLGVTRRTQAAALARS